MADWINSDPRWQKMGPDQKAAAMALLEVGADNPLDAIHVTGAMINRAQKERKPLGEHVGSSAYQPSFDDNAKARFDEVLASPHLDIVSDWVKRRQSGEYADPVNGATHFLMSPKDMLAQEKKNPSLYKDWGPRGSNWTGYDPQANPDMYGYEVFADKSHRFLTPKEHGGTIAQDPERVGFDPKSMPNYGGAPGVGATPGPTPGAAPAPTAPGRPAVAAPGQPAPTAPGQPAVAASGGPPGRAGAGTPSAPSPGSLFAGLQSLFGDGGSTGAAVDPEVAKAKSRAYMEQGKELAKSALAKAASTAATPSAPPTAPAYHPNYAALANTFGTDTGFLNKNLFSLNSLFGAPRQS